MYSVRSIDSVIIYCFLSIIKFLEPRLKRWTFSRGVCEFSRFFTRVFRSRQYPVYTIHSKSLVLPFDAFFGYTDNDPILEWTYDPF